MKKALKPLLFNTIKITGAAILSIFLASIFHLDFAVSAGIITILTIQPTKKETLQTAAGRFYAFIAALAISFISFTLLGYKSTRTLETTPITAKTVSDLFLEISENYHRNNTASELLEHFYKIQKDMKEKPLPTNRKEFEDRARLFILLNYIEEFLKIKRDFMGKY